MIVTSFNKGLTLHSGDAIMNLSPIGFLCNLGIQYMEGSFSIFSSVFRSHPFKNLKWDLMIEAEDFLINLYVILSSTGREKRTSFLITVA